MVLDNPHPNVRAPPTVPPVAQNPEDYSKNFSLAAKTPSSNDNPERESPHPGSLPPESIIQPLQQVALHSGSEAFYPASHSGEQ